MITLEDFKLACPTNKEAEDWVHVLNEILPKYEINTLKREAMFLAQCGHESSDFKATIENMNYTAARLMVVFPKYYTSSLAQKHSRKPVDIANHVYGGRMGNKKDNDGWFFRGIGIIHLTGRNNHTAFGKTIGMSAEEAREYMQTKKGMVEAACWFWKTNGLNVPSDNMDVERATRIINGGLKGISDRTDRFLKIIRGTASAPSQEPKSTIYKVGSRGTEVSNIQRKLGINPDGVFGPATKLAVRKFQSSKGLAPDGIVGKETLKKLGL